MVDSLQGYNIYEDPEGVWRFTDTNEPTATTWFNRPCGHCGEHGNSNDGKPDPCLGNLAGVTNACCGHGDPSQAYICFNGGLVIRGFTVAEYHHRDISDEEQDLITGHNGSRKKFAKLKENEDYYVDCTNDECDWRGLHSECYALGEIEPLCPECKDTTEPAQELLGP